MSESEMVNGSGLKEFATIIEQAARIKLINVNDTPILVHRVNDEVKQLTELRERPVRIQEYLIFTDPDSFSAYYNKFATDNSVVLFDADRAHFVGILDYHAPDLPDWGNHIIRYQCPLDKRWMAWRKYDDTGFTQSEFAEFIEDNAEDVVKPEAAKLLEIVKSIQATKNVVYKSSENQDNGSTKFIYNEIVEGKAGATGELQIPNEIELGIPVFERGADYKLRVKLRYRLSEGGNLTLRFKRHRPDLVEDNARDTIAATIQTGIGKGALLRGRIAG